MAMNSRGPLYSSIQSSPREQICGQENLAAKTNTTQARTRFSRAHVIAVGSSSIETPAIEGAQATNGRLGSIAIDERDRSNRVIPPIRTLRLRTATEFSAVRSRGRPYQRRQVTMKVLRTNQTATRFGFVTAKRVGNAVVRNRVRRRLRAIVRTELGQIDSGWDVVISARDNASDATFAELRESIIGMAAQSGIVTVAADSTE
ncbi:MAG: ribonuclease P protein component [Chloroflexota bacterium]|nr:MAG: ribonuclease P protein component [Chloroflexota bacterium]